MEKIRTMGGKSDFQFKINEKKELFIQYGMMTKPIKVKDEIIVLVRNRVKTNHPPIMQASYYNQKKWSECKNNRASPYIAQLILLAKI
jgi:hypothetical protein